MIIAAVDVQYDDEHNRAQAALILFDHWEASEPRAKSTEVHSPIQPYVPGEFYRREMPCIQAMVSTISELPDLIIVDGYVDLGVGRPGLGRHLYNAYEGKVAVVGVAKTRFHSAPSADVLRGASTKPLYVTGAGIDLQDAVNGIKAMHGSYRIPDLLKLVDHLARGRD